jgi:hypothetical protein
VPACGGEPIAAMMSNQFMDLTDLLSWAEAPWDFWYPPDMRNMLMTGMAPIPSGPPTAVLATTDAQDAVSIAV